MYQKQLRNNKFFKPNIAHLTQHSWAWNLFCSTPNQTFREMFQKFNGGYGLSSYRVTVWSEAKSVERNRIEVGRTEDQKSGKHSDQYRS